MTDAIRCIPGTAEAVAAARDRRTNPVHPASASCTGSAALVPCVWLAMSCTHPALSMTASCFASAQASQPEPLQGLDRPCCAQFDQPEVVKLGPISGPTRPVPQSAAQSRPATPAPAQQQPAVVQQRVKTITPVSDTTPPPAALPHPGPDRAAKARAAKATALAAKRALEANQQGAACLL